MTIFLAAVIGSWVATGLLIPCLNRLNVLDVPNSRSSHQRPVPRGGGTSVLVVAFAVVLVAGVSTDLGVVLVASAAMAVVGLVDDLSSLPVMQRLGAQLVTAIALAGWFHFDRGSNWPLGIGVTGLVAIWLVGYLNAFNFMDGINAISGLNGAVAGLWFAWLGAQGDDRSLVVVGLALSGACLGFLPWNISRARVFLGDVGSYGVGMMIAGLSVYAVYSGHSLFDAVAPLLLYLADTAWTLGKRVHQGQAWREAHREHVYQQLVDLGWGHTPVAVLTATAAAAMAVLAALVPQNALAAGAAVVLTIAYLSLPRMLPTRKLVP